MVSTAACSFFFGSCHEQDLGSNQIDSWWWTGSFNCQCWVTSCRSYPMISDKRYIPASSVFCLQCIHRSFYHFSRRWWGKKLLSNWRMMLLWRGRCTVSTSIWMSSCWMSTLSTLKSTPNYYPSRIVSSVGRLYDTSKSHQNMSILNYSKTLPGRRMHQQNKYVRRTIRDNSKRGGRRENKRQTTREKKSVIPL